MTATSPQRVLARYYSRNGVLRVPNPARLKTKRQKQKYHKGYEVRLVAYDRTELAEIRRALKAAKFEPGKPFEKVGRHVVPVYGKLQVERLLAVVEAERKRGKQAAP